MKRFFHIASLALCAVLLGFEITNLVLTLKEKQ